MTQRIPQLGSKVQIFEGKASGSATGVFHIAIDESDPGILKIGRGSDPKGITDRFLQIDNTNQRTVFYRDLDVQGSDVLNVNELNGLIVSQMMEGPGSSIDNAIGRFSGTGGQAFQNSNVFVTDGAGLGINVTVPSGGVTNTLHIMDVNQSNAHYDAIANLIVENNDARLQIISEDAGNQASTIFLTNVPASGDNKHWSLHAQGTSRSDRFDIAFQRTSTGPVTLDGTTYLTITTDGRTGIGTIAPDGTSKLHLASGSAGVVVANGSSVLVVERSTTAYISILTPDANNGGVLFGTPTSAQHGGILYFPSLNEMQFRTGQNNTRMVIENDNVGIGDTAPEVRLTVLDTDTGITNSDGIVKATNSSATTGKNIAVLRFSGDSTLGTTDYMMQYYDSAGLVGSINQEVVYNPFTGGHLASFPLNAKHGEITIVEGTSSLSPFTGSQYVSGSPEIAEGMVVYSTGKMCFSSSISNALPEVNITSASAEKRVFGVYVGYSTSEFAHCSGSEMYLYNAVGEGGILATDQSGNISAGDLLMSSDRYGHAVKQPDDIIRSYTIAKATEDIDFSPLPTSSAYGFKSKLIGCTYLCG